jgi:hypothetical protein
LFITLLNQLKTSKYLPPMARRSPNEPADKAKLRLNQFIAERSEDGKVPETFPVPPKAKKALKKPVKKEKGPEKPVKKKS